MFRPMRRFRQQLSEEEAMTVLRDGHLGVLSVLGDDDYPYGVPIDYVCGGDGHLYFHCAGTGHKIDAVRKHDKASFCVTDGGVPIPGDFGRMYRSVIVFGRIRVVEDRDKVLKKAWELAMHIYPERESFYREDLKKNAKNVQILELVPEHITGKQVRER
ncbi:MAG: pyridoxamine 5'-phosphate oxidase family protein [Lachnospiraceae bacterium]|jgi:nitroimidazol reductase NimA-like FMN-containing flavoprotein (pyridoxamine 5'-phosphate oxidase superfamily)